MGGGPGDPGLITVRGLELLKNADAVVYDALINPLLLNFAAPSALQFDAGKRHGEGDYLSQKQINQMLVRLARRGMKVVRLKGGDPFVFGRGGEEARALKKAGISFEVVPGVSAGFAVPAYAGIPVTDRALASQVTFVTGHEDPLKEQSALDWKVLGSSSGTLVFFMGVKNLSRVSARLMREGMGASMPAAMIESGTLPKQRVVEGTLRNLAEKVKKAGISSPALLVVGKVSTLRKQLSWFKPSRQMPLSGKTVLVTRARRQSSFFRKSLEDKGASVLEFPAIEVLPPRSSAEMDRAVRGLENFDWILFTSVHGVEYFMQRLRASGRDARALSGVRIAAVGDTTKQSLENHGLRADFIPKKFTAKSLVRELARKGQVKGRSFLLPRTDIAPMALNQGLAAAGGKVTQVNAYRTVPGFTGGEKKALQSWLERKKIDCLTFTSSSTVQNFLKAISRGAREKIRKSPVRIVSIGPVTSGTLRKAGFKVYREAKEHTLEGLLKAIHHV